MIEARGLRAGYENGYVIKDVEFSIVRGEFVALLGPNGSGKSTLIKAFQNLVPELSGEILLDGENIKRLKRREIAKKLAYVPQVPEPLFDFSVEEVVEMGRFAKQKRLSPLSADDRRAISSAMAKTGLNSLRRKRVAQLSGGERQRVFIARALAQETPLLLLDEPSLHLDLNFQVEIYSLLKELQHSEKKTILVAEHNVNLAAGFSERFVFLKDGKIEDSGPVEKVITEEIIKKIFGVEAAIRANASTGLPEISLVFKKPGPKQTEM